MNKLKDISMELRRNIMKMAYKAGGSHIAPCFSCIDILTVIYFGGVLKYDSNSPKWADRDRFILSKGHASAALFSVLAKAGYFEEELLDTYCQKDSILGGHPKMDDVPGVEASTGALGHGMLYAGGIALAGKLNKASYRVFTIIGDGECQEGSIWEGALFAAQNRLGNLTVILDYNELQAMDRLANIVSMEPMKEKWTAFGWDVIEVDGHNLEMLKDVLGKERDFGSKPLMVIAHTIKGKGVSFMEGSPIWHFRLPNKEEMEIILRELEFEDREWLKL